MPARSPRVDSSRRAFLVRAAATLDIIELEVEEPLIRLPLAAKLAYNLDRADCRSQRGYI